jgi:pyridoxamine 5'-phosphate oxidase
MPLYKEYLPDPLPAEPLELAAAWLAEATREAVQPNPNAMVLATADQHAQPSARVVLCKEIVPRPGYLSFYSNYESRKGTELAANPQAAVVMHWDRLHRQVRVEGPVVPAPPEDSDAYFATRAWQSRIGAWASRQSTSIPSRAALAAAVERAARRFGAPSPLQSADDAPDPAVPIPRPPHWGGYQLWAATVELWVEGSGRLHDRARWTRALEPATTGFTAGTWSVTRLQP